MRRPRSPGADSDSAAAFHVELKDGRETVRAFNLSEEEVLTRFIRPLQAGVRFSFEDKEFDPRQARLTVVEGARMAPGELGLGLGWSNALKRGADVTARFLANAAVTAPSETGPESEVIGRLRERVLGRLAAGPLPLDQAVALTGDLLDGHRVSVRLAAVETVVWELLHTGAERCLARDGQALEPGDWEAAILAAATWFGSDTPIDLI